MHILQRHNGIAIQRQSFGLPFPLNRLCCLGKCLEQHTVAGSAFLCRYPLRPLRIDGQQSQVSRPLALRSILIDVQRMHPHFRFGAGVQIVSFHAQLLKKQACIKTRDGCACIQEVRTRKRSRPFTEQLP